MAVLGQPDLYEAARPDAVANPVGAAISLWL
jgi:hypothetical protein